MPNAHLQHKLYTKMNYYYTTPIFYVNDKPHIGHAYSTILCDFLARYAVLSQHNCIWSTGTDEHGQKIASSAQKAKQNPQDYVDEISRHFFAMCNKLSCSQFIFNRTTSAKHIGAVNKMWNLLWDSGYIYQGQYAGWYAVRDEAFYTDAEVDNGIAVATGASVEWIEESAYFFRLSAMTEQLLEFYDTNPYFIYPVSRYNEVKSFVRSGLKDISVSRTKDRVSWGIPVPGDPTQTIYVWLDALTTYISSLDFEQTASAAFQDFWQNPNAMITHIIGKDILRFHAVYWPAFLMAAKLPLPKRIVAHGWWTNEGQKISKSLGNTIDPMELVQHFGTEYLRYFVLREVPIGLDGNFSKENLITRVNAELADNVGNLIQRTWSMIYKYDLQFHEIVFDESLIANGYKLAAEAQKRAEQYDISGYLECILSISSSANAYIAAQKPWALAKNQQTAPLLIILMSVVELVRVIAVLLEPVMPAAAKKIFTILNIAPEFCTLRYLTRQYAIQHKPLQATELIFPRIISQPEVSNNAESAG